ncbi:ATP synthase F1 subunit gamma [Anaerofustis stercorihominis]|uniref:ATP synthase gamma chain n=1 Tax=Anaerofustis stercorihominis DSM 17244 TaxID=445971 RepID=B1CAM3_9FIRM|nr:ATP synthase F1 subunit gamma [Anaerofustis stercorihominis]EDS72496.1 ATP synthase F1, gamma subunit [Anaerofustis stercorihominis DSM 17244]MCQ4795265.1 ATP synthase F1 subunit gamma [Anaerofustis stercorihominis]
MAENMADIKRRMKSVSSTKQITKAMELVASSKLRKAKERAICRSHYTDATYQLMLRVAKYTSYINNIYFKDRENADKTIYVVLSGDKGLAGGFNTNVIKQAVSEIGDEKEKAVIFALGAKGADYFKKNDYDVVGEYIGISDDPNYGVAKKIIGTVINLYTSDEDIRKVKIIYSKFNSVVSQGIISATVLPISRKADNSDGTPVTSELVIEPGGEELLEELVPQYITSLLYGAMIENNAGEEASRRMAMSAATDNANELLEELEIRYNSARQSSITNELIEIVSGAEALK